MLVLERQSSNENLQDVLNEISTILNECGEEKWFIYIVNKQFNTEQISELRGFLKEKLTQVYDEWKFTDLVTDSVKFLLEKTVNFQGTELQIKNLVKESDFHILNTLDFDTISLLIANEKPSIGTPIENPPEYYIERTL
jgi:type III secretory pathway lipoprotein EscJ